MANRNGFSLIELLVVISIIAVLSGFLLSAIGMVKRQAKSMACQGHLRQLYLAAAVYADENEGIFPAATAAEWHWYTGIGQNLGVEMHPIGGTFVRNHPVLDCPGMPNDPATWKCGYQVNEHVYNARRFAPLRSFTRWGHRGETNLFLCGTGQAYFHDKWWFRTGGFGTWHNGSTNAVMLDGHTENRVIRPIPGDANGYREGWNGLFMNPQ